MTLDPHVHRQPLVFLAVERDGDDVAVDDAYVDNERRVLATVEGTDRVYRPVPTASVQNGHHLVGQRALHVHHEHPHPPREQQEQHVGRVHAHGGEDADVVEKRDRPLWQQPSRRLRQPEEEFQKSVQIRQRERGQRKDAAVLEGRSTTFGRRATLAVSTSVGNSSQFSSPFLLNRFAAGEQFLPRLNNSSQGKQNELVFCNFSLTIFDCRIRSLNIVCFRFLVS